MKLSQKLTAAAAFFAITVSALAIPPVPRKSPEFTIVEPSGKETLLSSYHGHVVLLGFFATWCQHCQNTAKVFSALQNSLGPQGFQALGIAINPEANNFTVTEFTRQFANFPVGLAKPDSALSYLGISVMDRWVYPQVVVIDRKGNIRAQSDIKGTPTLQEEKSLREMIEPLLKESAATKTTSSHRGSR